MYLFAVPISPEKCVFISDAPPTRFRTHRVLPRARRVWALAGKSGDRRPAPPWLADRHRLPAGRTPGHRCCHRRPERPRTSLAKGSSQAWGRFLLASGSPRRALAACSVTTGGRLSVGFPAGAAWWPSEGRRLTISQNLDCHFPKNRKENNQSKQTHHKSGSPRAP